MPRTLHVIDRAAHDESGLGLPPLLFVHGGYTHSGCWGENFLAFFQQRGYHCVALDLSGHGKSAGRDLLDDFGIDDYADDVRQVAASLDCQPVLIGHSMGAIVVQRYLEKSPARGVVMLAPVPPTGVSASAMRLAARQPDYFCEAERTLRGDYTENTIRVMHAVYFSPDASLEDLRAFLPMVQDESMRAIADLVALLLRQPRKRPRIPALVIGGELDALFPANRLYFTAAGWNAETCVIPRAGHILTLDPQWPQVAAKIDGWLQRNFATQAVMAAGGAGGVRVVHL
ncbi:MAG: alpha/beta hydrolase [Propionivibrio sp.]